MSIFRNVRELQTFTYDISLITIIYFLLLIGGFEAFRSLQDAHEFIDRNIPLFINYITTDDSSCSDAASPSLSDNSEASSIVSRVFNDNVISLNGNNNNINTNNKLLLDDISCYKLDNFESNDTEKLISCLKDCSRDETLVVRIKQTPLRVNEIQQNNDDVLSASISQILPFLYLGKLLLLFFGFNFINDTSV